MRDALTDDDKVLLLAIMDEPDPEKCTNLVFAYYHDADRAGRTDRPTMYLHMGMLCGLIARLLPERDPR